MQIDYLKNRNQKIRKRKKKNARLWDSTTSNQKAVSNKELNSDQENNVYIICIRIKAILLCAQGTGVYFIFENHNNYTQ